MSPGSSYDLVRKVDMVRLSGCLFYEQNVVNTIYSDWKMALYLMTDNTTRRESLTSLDSSEQTGP